MVARVRRKQQILDSLGLPAPALTDSDLSGDDLARWYFEERLGCDRPADVEAYARQLDFADEQAFWRAVLRERLASRLGLEAADA
jgi:hypothetical protein